MFFGYIISLFAEGYYYNEHAFRIYCIAKGACPESISVAVHKLMYLRALLGVVFQSFAIYLTSYLMIAIGFFTDRRELLIRDLDEYGVKRSKGFAIYDITKTNKPYYASLRENAAEDEKALQEKYLIVKEGEDQAKASRDQARAQPMEVSGGGESKKMD